MKNNLMKAMNKQNETIGEIRDLCTKEFLGSNIMNMRPEELKLMQLALRLVAESVEVRIETAKVLEEIQRNMELLVAERTKES